MPNFDIVRALNEEIMGLGEVQKALRIRETAVEKAMTEMESELNALRKLRGFADAELERKRAVLRAEEAKREAGQG